MHVYQVAGHRVLPEALAWEAALAAARMCLDDGSVAPVSLGDCMHGPGQGLWPQQQHLTCELQGKHGSLRLATEATEHLLFQCRLLAAQVGALHAFHVPLLLGIGCLARHEIWLRHYKAQWGFHDIYLLMHSESAFGIASDSSDGC